MSVDVETLEWETCNCAWCGSQESRLLFEGPDRVERLPGQFRFVTCNNCGLIRQDPRLSWESLKHYYPDNYHAYISLVKDEKNRLRKFNRRYYQWKFRKNLERYQSSGKLLDVGCGTGLLLEEFERTKNWQTMGIEPNERAAKYASQQLGIKVLHNQLTQVNLPPESFDVITFINVLEHLPDPIENLRTAYKLIKPGGWLIFSIPHVESLDAKLFGKYWIGWDLPRHLYLFPRTVLHSILENLDFQWIGDKYISNSYATIGLSLENWALDNMNRQQPIIRNLVRFYNSWLVRFGLIVPLSIMDRLKLTTLLTVFAQK